jgi:hypothetical protein
VDRLKLEPVDDNLYARFALIGVSARRCTDLARRCDLRRRVRHEEISEQVRVAFLKATKRP